jgi:glutaminase
VPPLIDQVCYLLASYQLHGKLRRLRNSFTTIFRSSQRFAYQYKSLQAGTVANYIPELAKVNPNLFSICIVTVDGQIYEVGDYEQLFTIESISKVFVYRQVLEDPGRDYVLTRVGIERTVDAFNPIILNEQSKRPYNPMVNAGAIAITSLIEALGPTERLNWLLDMYPRYIGRDVFVDISVYTSERSTGHCNRATAHLMLNFGMIDQNIEEYLDLYFQ